MSDQPPAAAALDRLKAGNQRFVSGQASPPRIDRAALQQLAKGQKPFAIVLTCSDSRLPAELIFDCGFGDLFMVRVAGNIVAPSLIGSIEFAASVFETRLIVVMGHSACGAVQATLDVLRGGTPAASDNIRDIVERVSPAARTVLDAAKDREDSFVLQQAIRANVRSSVDHLRHGSRILEELGRNQGLLIVGAEYDLASGKVEFFDQGRHAAQQLQRA